FQVKIRGLRRRREILSVMTHIDFPLDITLIRHMNHSPSDFLSIGVSEFCRWYCAATRSAPSLASGFYTQRSSLLENNGFPLTKLLHPMAIFPALAHHRLSLFLPMFDEGDPPPPPLLPRDGCPKHPPPLLD